MINAVSWNLRLVVREGRLEEFRTLMHEMVRSTEAEPGTTAYEWYISDDGVTCHLHECYADSGAALTHLGSFGANFAERFLGCVEPTSLCVYGEPSNEVRAILDGWGPTYLGPFGGFRR